MKILILLDDCGDVSKTYLADGSVAEIRRDYDKYLLENYGEWWNRDFYKFYTCSNSYCKKVYDVKPKTCVCGRHNWTICHKSPISFTEYIEVVRRFKQVDFVVSD